MSSTQIKKYNFYFKIILLLGVLIVAIWLQFFLKMYEIYWLWGLPAMLIVGLCVGKYWPKENK